MIAFGQKFASIKDLSELSEADREIWEHLATTFKNSNKGIKGRGKKDMNSEDSQSPSGSAFSSFSLDEPTTTMHPQGYAADHPMTPQSSVSPGSSVGFPSPTGHNPAMLDAHMGGMYDPKVSGGDMMAPSAPGGMYPSHARDVVFHDRAYARAY